MIELLPNQSEGITKNLKKKRKKHIKTSKAYNDFSNYKGVVIMLFNSNE